MSHNGYTTRIGIFISYTLMRGILGTTHVQPGDGRGRGGAMGDEESCGKERPEPGRDGTEMQTRAGDRAGVNWSRPLVRRVTMGVAAPLTEVSTSWYSWRPPATLQFKDHWLLSHQLLAYSPFYQSFPLLGRKNKDVQWSFPVFHIKKKTHLQTKNTHLSSEQCQCEWGGGLVVEGEKAAVIWNAWRPTFWACIALGAQGVTGFRPQQLAQTGIVLLLFRWRTLNVQEWEKFALRKRICPPDLG